MIGIHTDSVSRIIFFLSHQFLALGASGTELTEERRHLKYILAVVSVQSLFLNQLLLGVDCGVLTLMFSY